MTDAKTVREDAKKLFISHPNKYPDISDAIKETCLKHNHPVFESSACLCQMFASQNKEIVMAAVLFVDGESIAQADSDTFIVFAPDDTVSEVFDFNGDDDNSIDEFVETYADQGAAKVHLSQLVDAYNKVHKTKLKI